MPNRINRGRISDVVPSERIAAALRHHHRGELDQAQAIYQQILQEQPKHAPAMHLLGVIHHQKGNYARAAECIQDAIRLDSANADYHANLALALTARGRYEEALAEFDRTIHLKPDHAEAHISRGNVLKDLGRLDEAISAYRQGITVKPDLAEAHYNLAVVLSDRGRLDDAVGAYRRAVALKPDFPEALSNLGIALRDNGQFDQAIAACRQAIALRPGYAEAFYNLGNALHSNDRTEEALAAYRQAIALNPKLAEAHYNLGIVLRDKKQFDEALTAFRHAIDFTPDHADAHYSLASALLAKGDFQEGWEQYEWRWKVESAIALRPFVQPRWNGADIARKTILLHPEQGVGDAIQFVRYAPLLAERGAKVILECPKELLRLMQRVPGVEKVSSFGDPLPAFDVHCPLASLPLAFGTTLETIPSTVPYLSTDPSLMEVWRERLGSAEGRLRIGLAWAGNPQFKGDQTRSLTLNQLSPLAAVRSVKFYSLQKGVAARQIANAPPGLELTDLSPGLEDFADTAAVMSLMDLIITTDTSVPHLAGALARPVWIMLQAVPDFRWLLERQDSPWYPTMRLFRQTEIGDWESVIHRVIHCLESDPPTADAW